MLVISEKLIFSNLRLQSTPTQNLKLYFDQLWSLSDGVWVMRYESWETPQKVFCAKSSDFTRDQLKLVPWCRRGYSPLYYRGTECYHLLHEYIECSRSTVTWTVMFDIWKVRQCSWMSVHVRNYFQNDPYFESKWDKRTGIITDLIILPLLQCSRTFMNH